MRSLSDQDQEEVKYLPFSEAQQEAIVGYCLMDPIFFMKCYRMIKPTWFTHNARVATVFSQLCKFYDEHQRPTKHPAEIAGVPFFLEMPMAEREQYNVIINRCLVSSKHSADQKTIEKYLTGFIRICMFKEAIQGGANVFKVKGFEDAYNKTRDKLQEIEKATFEDDSMVMPFVNPEIWLSEDAVEKSKIISTGSANLDSILQGGLYPGDATMILAPTNTGKTTLMLTLARHAAYQGKDVLVIMHEGKPRSIRRQLLAAMVGISKHELVRMAENKQASLLREAAEYLDKHITYVHYSKALGMYVEDVIAEIRKRNDAKRLKDGKGYDLVVDDYPGKQKSRVLSSQHAPRHEELAYIYDQYQLLSGELGFHSVVASQTNKEGYSKNKVAEEQELYLDLDNIGGSFAINNNMPNVIALNRSNQDKSKNLLHLTALKSRDNQTHITLHTFTDYECSLTHGDSSMFQRFNASKLKDVGLVSSITNDNSTHPTDTIFTALEQIRMSKQEEIDRLRAR